MLFCANVKMKKREKTYPCLSEKVSNSQALIVAMGTVSAIPDTVDKIEASEHLLPPRAPPLPRQGEPLIPEESKNTPPCACIHSTFEELNI